MMLVSSALTQNTGPPSPSVFPSLSLFHFASCSPSLIQVTLTVSSTHSLHSFVAGLPQLFSQNSPLNSPKTLLFLAVMRIFHSGLLVLGAASLSRARSISNVGRFRQRQESNILDVNLQNVNVDNSLPVTCLQPNALQPASGFTGQEPGTKGIKAGQATAAT